MRLAPLIPPPHPGRRGSPSPARLPSVWRTIAAMLHTATSARPAARQPYPTLHGMCSTGVVWSLAMIAFCTRVPREQEVHRGRHRMDQHRQGDAPSAVQRADAGAGWRRGRPGERPARCPAITRIANMSSDRSGAKPSPTRRRSASRPRPCSSASKPESGDQHQRIARRPRSRARSRSRDDTTRLSPARSIAPAHRRRGRRRHPRGSASACTADRVASVRRGWRAAS